MDKLARWSGVLALALVVGACCRPRATPAPAFSGAADSVSRDTALAYAHSLTFDTSEVASDAQYLLDSTSRRVYAKILPEIGAAAIDSAGLARGRVLARLKLDSTYTLRLVTGHVVSTYTLPRGGSFLWVRGVPGTMRMALVPDSASLPVVELPCRFHAGYGIPKWERSRPAVARFKVAPPAGFDDTICIACDNGWCCAET